MVRYEWDCETVADGESELFEDGEVIDHAHGASLADVLAFSASNPPEEGTRHEIVLVRDDDSGRSWAYINGGELPAFFTDAEGDSASKVPQRFHHEAAKAGKAKSALCCFDAT